MEVGAKDVIFSDTSFDRYNSLCPNLKVIDIDLFKNGSVLQDSHFARAHHFRRFLAVRPGNITDKGVKFIAQGMWNVVSPENSEERSRFFDLESKKSHFLIKSCSYFL